MSEIPALRRYRLGTRGPTPQWGLEISGGYIDMPMPDLRLVEKIVLVNVVFGGGQWWDGKGALPVDTRLHALMASLSERSVQRALKKLVELDYLALEQ